MPLISNGSTQHARPHCTHCHPFVPIIALRQATQETQPADEPAMPEASAEPGASDEPDASHEHLPDANVESGANHEHLLPDADDEPSVRGERDQATLSLPPASHPHPTPYRQANLYIRQKARPFPPPTFMASLRQADEETQPAAIYDAINAPREARRLVARRPR